MINTVILSYTTFIYLISFILYLLMIVTKKEAIGRFATIFILVGLAAHTFGIILRWAATYQLGIGHAPLSNFYESLIFFSWTIILLYVIMEWRTKNKSIGALIAPIAFFAMAYASFSPDIQNSIQPLVPALRSNWLLAHVLTCFFGYAGFGLSFGISIAYLLKKSGPRDNKSSLTSFIPDLSVLDELSYQMVAMGFLMLTLGIITGSVWAHSAWGRYWNWDPKETWSLITWLVYAALLHSRMIRGWRGKRLAILSIIGFACVMFTYFGVNYLSSLHSYANV